MQKVGRYENKCGFYCHQLKLIIEIDGSVHEMIVNTKRYF